jgi:hypothetical protein
LKATVTYDDVTHTSVAWQRGPNEQQWPGNYKRRMVFPVVHLDAAIGRSARRGVFSAVRAEDIY